MLKKILISLGIIVVATGLTVGILYIVKQNNTEAPADEPTTDKVVLDLSKDYGACSMLDETAIKNSLGDVAANLQGPQNMGIVGDVQRGEGTEDLKSDSQMCVFAFANGGTLENGYNSDNALLVQKTKYTNENGPASQIEQIKKDPTASAVEGLGDSAFYTPNSVAQGPNAVFSFELVVFTGNERTSYMIRQPADKATFTDETAKTALLSLEKSTK